MVKTHLAEFYACLISSVDVCFSHSYDCRIKCDTYGNLQMKGLVLQKLSLQNYVDKTVETQNVLSEDTKCTVQCYDFLIYSNNIE